MYNIIMKDNYQDIKHRISELNLTQAEFAACLSVSAPTLSLWLNARSPISQTMLDKVYGKLEVLESAERAATVARQRVLDIARQADEAAEKARAQVIRGYDETREVTV